LSFILLSTVVNCKVYDVFTLLPDVWKTAKLLTLLADGGRANMLVLNWPFNLGPLCHLC